MVQRKVRSKKKKYGQETNVTLMVKNFAGEQNYQPLGHVFCIKITKDSGPQIWYKKLNFPI
jgi:hypothetical protein